MHVIKALKIKKNTLFCSTYLYSPYIWEYLLTPPPAPLASDVSEIRKVHYLVCQVSIFIIYFLGMSPSRTSPSASQTEMNIKDRGDHQSPGVAANRTPPVSSTATLDPDHRNHRPGNI